MKYLVPILAIVALIAVVIAVIRRGGRQGPGTYQRRLGNTSPFQDKPSQDKPSQDNSFLYTGALAAGTDHGHHHTQGADCAPNSDSGASCSDAGGGGDGGGGSN
jgi:hypothetical protein